MTSQLAQKGVDDGGVLSGKYGQGFETAVEHDPVGGLRKVLGQESYGLAALSGSEPDLAEDLRDVPLQGRLVDPGHVTREQRHVGLEEHGPGATDLLECVTGPHAYEFVVVREDAPDQLVWAFGFGEDESDHGVDVVQRPRVGFAQLILDRQRRIEGLERLSVGRGGPVLILSP